MQKGVGDVAFMSGKPCIISICNETNTNLLHTNLLYSISCKIGHVMQIVVNQFVLNTTTEKKI
jgi:hypothetical protein